MNLIRLKFTGDELRALYRIVQRKEVHPDELTKILKHLKSAVAVLDRMEDGL